MTSCTDAAASGRRRCCWPKYRSSSKSLSPQENDRGTICARDQRHAADVISGTTCARCCWWAVEEPVKAVDVVRAVEVIQSQAVDVISGSHAVMVDVIVVDNGPSSIANGICGPSMAAT